MKNSSILLFLLLLSATPPAGAQALRVVSTKFYCNNQPTTFEKITDIIQTKDGGFFFTGKHTNPVVAFCPSVAA